MSVSPMKQRERRLLDMRGRGKGWGTVEGREGTEHEPAGNTK